jgi:hypothetical protein
MNTMTLINTAALDTDLLTATDAELEAWFANAGLTVAVVPHCDSAACPICFPPVAVPARAA